MSLGRQDFTYQSATTLLHSWRPTAATPAIVVEGAFPEVERRSEDHDAIACPLGAKGDVMPSPNAAVASLELALERLPLSTDNFVRRSDLCDSNNASSR